CLHGKTTLVTWLPFCEQRAIVKAKPCWLLRDIDVNCRTCKHGCQYESNCASDHRCLQSRLSLLCNHASHSFCRGTCRICVLPASSFTCCPLARRRTLTGFGRYHNWQAYPPLRGI